jgi:hypothetical protein
MAMQNAARQHTNGVERRRRPLSLTTSLDFLRREPTIIRQSVLDIGDYYYCSL